VEGIKAHLVKGNVTPTILRETPISITLDAEGAIGLGLSVKYMRKLIGMAETQGIGICCIRNSNHFGIAGYYTEMAARHDMIGIAMTNTAALGVPTFARDAMFGTNPIAFAAPGLDGKMFSLDMATTCVPRGKIEVKLREGKKLPPGWAVGKNGRNTDDPVSLLDDMMYQRGGGLLPLGGEGETLGGYKGYGLAVLVDIMTALCSGGIFGRDVKDTEVSTARVCHFLMALRLDLFRDPQDFKRDMSAMLDALTALKPAEGAERVYYAGLKEHEQEAFSNKHGVPLSKTVWETLKACAESLNVSVPILPSPTE
jgi:LDH2 family malate/lactate/ureidoglycolate dehydrogenase